MTHRAQLAILALLIVLALLAILVPRPAVGDAPVVAGAVPAGEFERVSLPFPHPEGLTVDEDFRGHLTDASRSHRVGTQRIAPGSPAPSLTPSPAARAPATMTGISGTASWFASPQGPRHRRPLLGRHLRHCRGGVAQRDRAGGAAMTTRDTPDATALTTALNRLTHEVKATETSWGWWSSTETFAAAILAALPPGWCGHEAPGKHEPGDPHQYRVTCEVCGGRGTIRLTVDPETALAPAPSEPG